MRCVFRSHYRDYKLNQAKIDDSQGMCGADSEYETCWTRFCSPNRSHVLRDVLRGLLVLIALAIVITIVFLICYFLINDFEKKEEEIVDTLIKDFSAGGKVEPEITINPEGNRIIPNDGDVYGQVDPSRGDMPPNKAKLRKEEQQPTIIDRNVDDKGAFRNTVPESPDPSENASRGQPAQPPSKTNIGDLFSDSEGDDQPYDVITEFVHADSANQCVPLRLPLCSGSMPWAVTSFPNFVNNNNMNELQESLNYFQSILVGSRCSTRATEYTCAILEPPCGPDAIPLPPCMAFCRDIVATCSEFFVNGNNHNAAFLCDQFPDSANPNVCVDISRAASTDGPKVQATGIGEQIQNSTTGGQLEPESKDLSNSKDSASENPLTDLMPDNEPDNDSLNNQNTHLTNPELAPKVTQNVNESTTDVSEASDSSLFICDHTKFLCGDGSDCLGDEAVCDGTQHCLDNSDELNCTKPEASTSNDLIGENSQPDTTTHLGFEAESTSQPQPTGNPFSKRPSLSDILSESDLVAVPGPPTLPPSSLPKMSRFSLANLKSVRGKTLDTPSEPNRNTFSSFGPFPFTAKPITTIHKNNQHSQSSKLSLAALLSSSSVTPVHLPTMNKRTNPSAIEYDEEEISPPSQRSLSSLLSSMLPSFSSRPLRRKLSAHCSEAECSEDGSCILLSQVGDGVLDCPSGSDEKQQNTIFNK